jgi:hypothetical protein
MRPSEISRRRSLGQISALATGATVVAGFGDREAFAQTSQQKKPDINAASIPVGKNFPAKMWKQKPWTLDAKGPYDLDDPKGNWHGLMKATQNLVGARTYVSSYSRIFLCELGKQPQVFYASCGSWTFQLVVPEPGQFDEDLPEGTALQLGLYTGVQLDPYTFKPVDAIYNPFLGKKVEVQDSVFAESYLLYPGGGVTSIERRQFMNDRTPKKHIYVKSGNNLAWSLPALFAGEGSFQPRMDSSFWTCKYDELMNPDLDLIDCDYSWVGLTRVAEKSWCGMEDTGVVLQTLWNTQGTVTNELSRVEGIVQDYVFSKYPERV